jgi:hypothetical protein
MLFTRDVSEIRLSDSSRVAELGTRLPGVRATWYAEALDTLALNASQAQMVARCGDVKTALLSCWRADDSIVGLLREVRREEEALRGIRPELATYLVSAPCGGLLGAAMGAIIGAAIKPPSFAGDMIFWDLGGGPYVAIVGCAAGSAIGVAVGRRLRVQALARRHRSRVNDLVRRANRIVASAP